MMIKYNFNNSKFQIKRKKTQFITLFGALFIFLQAKSQNKNEFDTGWNDGYKDGYCEYNLEHHKMKPVFIVPISPIAPIGYKTYREGYRLGLIDGKEDFLKQCSDCKNEMDSNLQHIVIEKGSFDEGWKAGYEDGYCDFNLSNHKMKPIFITPISPIAPIGYNDYKSGYRLGFKKGKENFESK